MSPRVCDPLEKPLPAAPVLPAGPGEGGRCAADPSPPLLGRRKPFPIGDKVTFSGKDCVCQNCSHSLLSTKPIKIHGPSRKLTAVLGWMLREGPRAPGEGDRTGFGATVQPCRATAVTEVWEEGQGSAAAPPRIAAHHWFRKLPRPVCDLGRCHHPGRRCLSSWGDSGAGFAQSHKQRLGNTPGTVPVLAFLAVSASTERLFMLISLPQGTPGDPLELGWSDGQALLGGLGLAFDPKLGVPSLPAMLSKPWRSVPRPEPGLGVTHGPCHPWSLSPSHHNGTAGGSAGADGPHCEPPKLPSSPQPSMEGLE